jgi:hypothetical protein
MTEMSNFPVNGPPHKEGATLEKDPLDKPLMFINKTLIQHAVRQVMMNEMGLTRDFIRGMAEELIKETIRKQAESMLNDSTIDKMIRSEINAKLWPSGRLGGVRSFEEIVTREITNKVQEVVRGKLSVAFELKP